MRIAYLNLVFIVILCGCASTVRIAKEGLVSKPLDINQISRLLGKEAQYPELRIFRYQRDSTGSKLFIGFSYRLNNEGFFGTAIVTSEGITNVPGFPFVWYNDEGIPTIRLEGLKVQYNDEGGRIEHDDDAQYVLGGTNVIPCRAISGLMLVSSGDTVIVKFTGDPAWVVSKLGNPRQPLLQLPADLDFPQYAGSTGGKLIIFGERKDLSGDTILSCLIYDESPLGYQLSEEIPLPWARSVYDVSAKTGDVLIVGTGQSTFAGYYCFNIWTKDRTWLGFCPSDYVLFLQEGLIRTLDRASK
ncbi:MAG: hypothetical protein ABSA47_06480 [Verrucomicrobiota bacterium]|jgi:hypothetical protein